MNVYQHFYFVFSIPLISPLFKNKSPSTTQPAAGEHTYKYTKNQTRPTLTFYLQIHLGLRKAVSFGKNVEFMDLLFVNQRHNHSATLLRVKYKILFLKNGNIIRNYN
jgi:hypothetical protein